MLNMDQRGQIRTPKTNFRRTARSGAARRPKVYILAGFARRVIVLSRAPPIPEGGKDRLIMNVRFRNRGRGPALPIGALSICAALRSRAFSCDQQSVRNRTAGTPKREISKACANVSVPDLHARLSNQHGSYFVNPVIARTQTCSGGSN